MSEHRGVNRTRRIVAVVVTVVAVTTWLVVFDKVWPAHANCVSDVSTGGCPTASNLSTKFRHGKMHNSVDLRLSREIRRKANRWIANHPNSPNNPKVAARNGRLVVASDWWRWPAETTQCIMWGGRTDSCMWGDGYGSQAPKAVVRETRIVMRETTRVTFKCGGAAMIGAMGGRLDSGKVGWWGAGFGGGACLYQHLGTKMDWW